MVSSRILTLILKQKMSDSDDEKPRHRDKFASERRCASFLGFTAALIDLLEQTESLPVSSSAPQVSLPQWYLSAPQW